jgi:hypothetical protein
MILIINLSVIYYLIKRWAEIVGVEVKIKKPKSKKIAVEIIFSKPLNLEKPKRQRK